MAGGAGAASQCCSKSLIMTPVTWLTQVGDGLLGFRTARYPVIEFVAIKNALSASKWQKRYARSDQVWPSRIAQA